jgi:hypothetical protein
MPMPRFTIRVVLHDDATIDEYLLLDQRLQDRNLSDNILGDDGSWYRLPPGEYHGHGDLTGAQVRDDVSRIVSQIKPRYEVFVTEGPMRYWIGLPRVA